MTGVQAQTRLTPDEVEALIADYQGGMSVREVAAKYHIHRTTALNHLRRAGIPRRPTPRRLTGADLDDAHQRRAGGDSYAAIASDYDVHPETVRRALLRHAR